MADAKPTSNASGKKQAGGSGVVDQPAGVSNVDTRGRRRRNVLTRMPLTTGPMSRLEECRVSGQRVSVFIRSINEICAICRGHIVVFDKHWNLVLRDVEHTYIPRTVLHPYLLTCQAPRRAKIEGSQWQECVTAASEWVANVSISSGDTAAGREGSREHGRGNTSSADYASLRRSVRLKEHKVSPESTAASQTDSHTGGIYMKNIKGRSYKQLFIRGDNVALVSIT